MNFAHKIVLIDKYVCGERGGWFLAVKQGTHFIGIGGSGMSGLAKILLELGQPVSGSDLEPSRTTKRLEELGAKIFYGHRRENIGPETHTVVRSTAISPTNEEILQAKELGIPIIHRGDFLAKLCEGQKPITVAGAHGKTTTTSMLAHIFLQADLDPTIYVGGELQEIGGNAKYGKGEYLIAEADESDGSFLKLRPYIAVVTNIEDDHLEHYSSKENLVKAFAEFLSLVAEEGFSVLCLDDPEVNKLAAKVKKKITYGLKPGAEYTARDIIYHPDCTRAVIYHKEKKLGILELPVPGIHNMSNALAAVAVSHQVGIDFQVIATGLKKFQSAGRRFQTIGIVNDVHIIDDYAHHPTEIRATLKAARQLEPNRIWAVFQPHRYTRTRQLFKEFGGAFGDADKVIVNSIYAASENPIPGITGELVTEEIKKHGVDAVFMEDKSEIVDLLARETRQGDLVITIGAGHIWTVGKDLHERMQK
jgi:UDP-N-acetylmuramate--alanine ligase